MRRPSHTTVTGICVVGVVAVAVYAIVGAFGWLVHPLGSCVGNAALVSRCKGYNFWSGIGSDLGEATLISAVGIGVYTGVRKVNCHTKGCWRIGKHDLDGTPYILCRHHHPGVPSKGASHAHILEQPRRWVESQGR